MAWVLHTCGRRVGFLAALVLLSTPVLAQGADRYIINQTYGDIDFAVRNLGLFTSHGGFSKWNGTLTIDPANPEHSQVDVNIQATSVHMPWEDGTAMLRSPDYFDVVDHPEIHFQSTAVKQVAQNHYMIDGILELRGVSRPQVFDATLVDRRPDSDLKSEIADFLVAGKLQRSWFGMTADTTFVSDTVDIIIRTRLHLGEALRAQ